MNLANKTVRSYPVTRLAIAATLKTNEKIKEVGGVRCGCRESNPGLELGKLPS